MRKNDHCNWRRIFQKVALLIVGCSVTMYAATTEYNVMKYNSIRIAHYKEGENIPVGFLVRAKKAGYNYVLGEFLLHRGNYSSMVEKKDDFKSAFKKVDAQGLRLIPLIQMGSSSAEHWQWAKDNWNPKIEMNRIHGKNKSGKHGNWGMPSLAEDMDGIDASFVELLEIIKQAHSEADVSYPLEFIHLGHDEPAFYKHCLIGGVKGTYSGEYVIYDDDRSYSQADRNFINERISSGDSTSEAFQRLIVDELYRRIGQVHAVWGNKSRIMIYGDAWDPELNGAMEMETYTAETAAMTPGIATLPGLAADQKETFRENVVMIPWNYDGNSTTGDKDYNAANTFSYLASNGFKFIYAHEITKDNIYPYPDERVAQANEYINESRNYQVNCLGFAAVHWSDWENRCYDSIEYLADGNAGFIPPKSFQYEDIFSPILNLLLDDEDDSITTFKFTYENNPLVKHVRTADPAAKVWDDGKLWIYTSHDMDDATDYHSMDGYHAFSTEDMVNWTDYGEIFHSRELNNSLGSWYDQDVTWSETEGGRMYAPDVAYKNGTYYLYFPTEPKDKGTYVIGVATSTTPEGPFKNVGGSIKGTDGIDPCVFIDDNGSAYLYWGGYNNPDGGHDHPPKVAKLDENMTGLAEDPKSIKYGNSDFAEGVFVFKRDGKYYYTYTNNNANGAYAMGTSPYGPFEYKGVISTHDKYGAEIHHSMVEYKDTWYYFYHWGNYNGGDVHKRNVAIDKFEFNGDGTIKDVNLTEEGAAPKQ